MDDRDRLVDDLAKPRRGTTQYPPWARIAFGAVMIVISVLAFPYAVRDYWNSTGRYAGMMIPVTLCGIGAGAAVIAQALLTLRRVAKLKALEEELDAE